MNGTREQFASSAVLCAFLCSPKLKATGRKAKLVDVKGPSGLRESQCPPARVLHLHQVPPRVDDLLRIAAEVNAKRWSSKMLH